MTTKYVWSGATGANNGTSWVNAYTTLSAAMTGITAADVIYVAQDHTEGRTSALTLNFPTSPGATVLCVDRTSGASAKTGIINTSIGSIGLNGYAIVYGLIFQTATGATNNMINLCPTSGVHTLILEECTFVDRSVSSSIQFLNFGTIAPTVTGIVRLLNPKIKFNATTRYIALNTVDIEIVGGSFDASGSTPVNLISNTLGSNGLLTIEGMDLSGLSFTNLVDTAGGSGILKFSRCAMPSSYTRFTASFAAGELWLMGCGNGATYGVFEYYDIVGSITSDSGVYLTAGVAAQSWKITTTSQANYNNPFITPWLDLFNTTLSSITPYFEVLRTGSSTPYTDAQIWGEFTAEVTSGVVTSSFYRDRQPLTDKAAGTTAANQPNGTGTGNWTGAGGTAWSGKVDSGSSLTPAVNGYIRGRVNVGVASSVVYLDPFVRN